VDVAVDQIGVFVIDYDLFPLAGIDPQEKPWPIPLRLVEFNRTLA
jgi:hypothetical protein